MRLLSLTLVSGRGLRLRSGTGAQPTFLLKSTVAALRTVNHCCSAALVRCAFIAGNDGARRHASTDSDQLRESKNGAECHHHFPVARLLVSNATGMIPARVAVGVSDVVPTIAINKSVVGVETVVACIGAPVAPIRVIPRRPDVLGARHNDRCIVCGVRQSRRTTKSGQCYGRCKYQLFHFDDRYMCHKQSIRFDVGASKIAFGQGITIVLVATGLPVPLNTL